MLELEPLTLKPIGVLRTPFPDRVSTPRQPHVAEGAAGTIELLPGRGFEHAVEDLEGWEYLWVVFWFHLNEGFRPKVLPPRSVRRRGVFSTRSPYRPNPIGLSLVKLEAVEGLLLRVRNVDMVDGSPVLDLKPYLPYVEAIPGARTGWVAPLSTPEGAPPPDPEPGFLMSWDEPAATQAAWLREAQGIDLVTPVERILKLGPQPHPYRRIRAEADGQLRLAMKDWRVFFVVEGRKVTVRALGTGYRERDLALSADPAVEPHRAFVARFGR